MAYKPTELITLAYADSFTLWRYVTEDDGLAKVLDHKYWQDKDFSYMINRGDRVHVCAKNGAADMVCSNIEKGKPESVRMLAMASCWYGHPGWIEK